MSFLNDLLDLEYEIVNLEYRNLEQLGLKIYERKAIYDVFCTDTKNNKFIVELQRTEQRYFRDRSIYYTTFPIQEQANKGTWDYELKRVYFVGILDFNMDDDENYIKKVSLYDEHTNKKFYDKLTYYYIEMPKFKKTQEELSNHLEAWLYTLNNMRDLVKIPSPLKDDEIIKEAFDVAEFLALDKDQQFAYQQDLKAKWDNYAVMSFAKEKAEEQGIKIGIEKGMERGIEKGIEQEKIDIAKNLIKADVDIETISLSTGLSYEEIEKLKK